MTGISVLLKDEIRCFRLELAGVEGSLLLRDLTDQYYIELMALYCSWVIIEIRRKL